jgi:hypothetical protein
MHLTDKQIFLVLLLFVLLKIIYFAKVLTFKACFFLDQAFA